MASKKKRNKRKHRSTQKSHQERRIETVSDNNKQPNTGEFLNAPLSIASEIRRLIDNNKVKTAVNRAKQFHKNEGTTESESILVRAYHARIIELIDKGHLVEAETLLNLIAGRYHIPDHAVIELQSVIFIRHGLIDRLVSPFRDPCISQEIRTAVEKVIKKELVDLEALAACECLDSHHPLRTSALTLHQTFTAVTTGPVGEKEIALLEIPRRSPLAPWKMLIKGLASFHRFEDQLCEKYLQAIDPDSAPARLIPGIRIMISGEMNGTYDSRLAKLIENVNGDIQEVHDAFLTLEKVFVTKKRKQILKAIRGAIAMCQQSCPEVLEKLEQHISVRSWSLGLGEEDVRLALGGSSLKNAYFWRLFARAAENKEHYLLACALWDEFIEHAVHECWFSSDSKELSVIYLHMVGLLGRFPNSAFAWERSKFERQFAGFESYYHGQTADTYKPIRDNNWYGSSRYFLYPEKLFDLACKMDPRAQNFSDYLAWLDKQDSHWKKTDKVALSWHAAIHDDTRPLLYLAKSADKRNAFNKSLGYLEKAEHIDELNPNVKRAILRVWASVALRHLKQKKTHLVQKDIATMEALPQLNEGERRAFTLALSCLCARVEGKKSEWRDRYNALVKLLDTPVAAQMIVEGICSVVALSTDSTGSPFHQRDSVEGDTLATAITRGYRLGDDMGFPVFIPEEYVGKLETFFHNNESSLDVASIRAVAEAALQSHFLPLAYAISGAGIAHGGATLGRFLLLRARSLPFWERARKDDCYRAAIELARRERDMDLLDEAIEQRRGKRSFFRSSLWGRMMDEREGSLDPHELDHLVHREIEAREYPSTYEEDYYDDSYEDEEYDDDDDYYDDDDFDDGHNCRYCDVKDCPNREIEYMAD